MTARVLIVSPDTGFGGLIHQTLEKVELYEPMLVSTGRQALELAKKLPFDLAILDADVADRPCIQLGIALRDITPKLRILIIPSDDPAPELDNGELHFQGYLTKPFYLPDLIEIVDGALKSGSPEGEVEEDQPAAVVGAESALADEDTRSASSERSQIDDPWHGNVNLAAQHLARLSLSTSSQAALILKRGVLWAYAGHLSQEAAQELAQIVQRDWKRSSEGADPDEGDVDLARFVRLISTGGEFLLYATSFESEMLLALAFDAQTPFSTIHTQVSNLVHALSSPINGDLLDQFGQEVSGSLSADSDKMDVDSDAENLSDIESLQWSLEFDSDLDEAASRAEGGQSTDRQAEGYFDESGIEPGWLFEKQDQRQFQPLVSTDVAQRVPSEDEDELADTQPIRVRPGVNDKIRSKSSVQYDIQYACVLVPRLPNHHLIGDLSTRLSSWVRRLSLAFGWRLEYLAVRPGWLQWIAAVPPEISAEQIVLLVRQRTSELIFSEFPRYTVENPSEDFWAPGYLVVTSSKPLPGELLYEFIEQTRMRQGIAG